ncbi:cobaltochelatase subunit CobN [Kineobactrum salinum]|uniref:Cobaltochelatase subunit CobN n=1 Tax=Kineobactrum salinum TaxID=2708301 RepID=A0A6C0U554_9GAMM|nr:cobaltochelatase subunit CobN [Kineobactrum salinum]
MVIDEQLDLLLDRAMRLVTLRRKAPASKKIALMYWSYPPGERGVSASNLNVPRSLAMLLPQLAAAGYQVDVATAATLEAQLPQLLDPWLGQVPLAQWTAQHPQFWAPAPLADYKRWFGQLPAAVRDKITARWGEPEQDAMVLGSGKDAAIVVPRIEFGQLVMLPQPARMPADSSLASYHDGDLPPPHAYLAAYWLLREDFAADALIHFGTHGNQEFLPGKERGLSVDDAAWLALGDLPVIYPYITDNIGEALQARRRGQAVTISHQTPPFAPAGLHGELLQVHDLLHEWQLLDDGPVRSRTEAAIIASIAEGTLYRDLGWERQRIEADFPAFQHELHLYLHELAVDAQPLGLHVFGSFPDPEHRVSTLMQMLGEDLYNALDLEDPSELFVDDYTQLTGSEPYRFVSRFVLEGEVPQLLADDTLRELAVQAVQWDRAMLDNNEIRHLLAALAGRYIPTTTGGDPIRNAGILPTGRNIFGFDPSRLPTERAWQVGRELADELIATHLETHQDYPESLAISLWSSEAMRQQGVMEAQMLHLLGLEPRWDRGGRLEQLVIVPAETLGRPRVDVVASITGIYRDQFPHFIEHLAHALTELAALDEPANPVSRHVQMLTQKLVGSGTDPVRARQLATIRVFSSASGSYGTGVPDGVLDTEGWDHDEELAQAYLARMQYGYGAGDGMWAVSLEDVNLYAENLGRVQGAILGRSSNLHGLLSTDHPFEYLGGIAMAVRSLSGTTPALYISNLRTAGGERNVSAARFLAGELRSRYQHPGWISAMQDEGYAGTLELLNVVNNFYGWQVTDPSMVRDDQWQAFHEVYLQDSLGLGLQAWFEEHNENAMQRIVERMLDAVRRDYWQADAATVQDLVERHRELAGSDGAGGKLGEYIETLSAGFGMETAGAGGAQSVTGQRLTQVDSQSAAAVPDPRPWLASLALLLMLGAGALRQGWRLRHLSGR